VEEALILIALKEVYVTIQVHVEGVIERGRFAEFLETVENWCNYRKEQGLSVPQILIALSGAMNTVRLVLHYESLADYEHEEALVARDPDYVKVANTMPFEGMLHLNIFKVGDSVE
jgi:NIPSNAP